MRNRTSSTSEYLAFLSAKYRVDPDSLFDALNEADGNRKSFCGELSIQRRGETGEKVMFLILTSSHVVAQFSVFKQFLLEKDHPIRSFMQTEKIQNFLARKARNSLAHSIKDLRNGMTQICLSAKVLEIPKPTLVLTRYGNHASVTNALIGDETGTINLCLWNEQIECIAAGDIIRIENARTSMFRGQIQLRIGRRGLVSSNGAAALLCETQPESGSLGFMLTK